MKLNELLLSVSKDYDTDRLGMINGINRVHDLERILSVVKMINNSLVLDEVFRLVVDYSIEVAKAERGFLLLADSDGKLRCKVARNSKKESLPLEETEISTTIVDDVHQTGESIFIENAQTDDHFDNQHSIVSLSLQTILCSSLNIKNEKVGVIYVDSRSILVVKKDEIIDLFEILAGQAAIAIKNAQLYERLRNAYKELEDANEQVQKFERMASRGEMAAELGHELNNSLSIAFLQLQALQKSSHRYSDEERQKKIKNALDALEKTILFTSGLIESSGFKTNKYPGDMNEVIQDFEKFIKILRKYRRSILVLHLDEHVPQLLFDKQQFQQVLLNLISNAHEAYNDATIIIRTIYDSSKKELVISVSDNGPGIIDEVKKKLFTQKITTKENGHGYGLPICRKIIENHNGTIAVESVVGRGTSFHITLPVDEN